MLIGQVVGTVVSTVKDEKMEGLKFQVVRDVSERGKATGKYVIAIDSVGAGHGDMVLYATGSSARQTPQTDGKPADAVIMAVIDSWDVDGDLVYDRQTPIARS